MDERKAATAGSPGGPPRTRPAWARLAGRALAAVWRLCAATWRVEALGVERLDALLARGRPVLAVFWHAAYPTLLPLLGRRPARVFTTRSRRGEVIAVIAERFGCRADILPEQGGEPALAVLRAALSGERLAGLAVDGPRGPRRSVKRGAVQLASELGWTLLPVAVAIRGGCTARRRWDRRELPLPLARVRWLVGEPIDVPPDLPPEAVASRSRVLRRALIALEREARAGPTVRREAL